MHKRPSCCFFRTSMLQKSHPLVFSFSESGSFFLDVSNPVVLGSASGAVAPIFPWLSMGRWTCQWAKGAGFDVCLQRTLSNSLTFGHVRWFGWEHICRKDMIWWLRSGCPHFLVKVLQPLNWPGKWMSTSLLQLFEPVTCQSQNENVLQHTQQNVWLFLATQRA